MGGLHFSAVRDYKMTPLVLLLAFISLLYGAGQIIFNVELIEVVQSPLDSQACTNGSVRLMYGSGPWEGNVQLCYNGIWGWVCDNSWTSNDARVVCNQLGYSTSSMYLHHLTLLYSNDRCCISSLFLLWLG